MVAKLAARPWPLAYCAHMALRPLPVLIVGVAALLVGSVLWGTFTTPSHHVQPGLVPAAPPSAAPQPPTLQRPPAPAAFTSPSANVLPEDQQTAAAPDQPSYIDQLAKAEARRRIRASAGYTYLGEIVTESRDSALHRWDGRKDWPVRVYLATGTPANFQPAFLDAVRTAFQRWEEAGVPVRFNLDADSDRAEVHFRWRAQFDIERTGQTDVTWDPEGRIQSATVTIATFDPHGHPLSPDDVRVVALHEIGHLIGLDHSADSTDVMFANTRVRDLSPRDIRTALMLYQLAPGPLR